MHSVNLKAIDASGNIATNANVTVAFPTGSQTVNVTSTGWANYTLTFFGGYTSLVSVEFQDVTVYSESVTFNVSSTLDVSCIVYSLQADVQWNTGEPVPNVSLTLLRSSTSINGLYGLSASPQSNSSGSYVWNQLAGNQTYTIQTGKGSSILTLTNNAVITVTYTESGSDVPHDIGTTQYTVKFVVKANDKPCENCQIQIYTSDYGDFVTKQMTDQDGKASISLAPGEYEYRASWMKSTTNGSWVHIEDTIIKLDFSSSVDVEKPASAIRVLIGSCVLVAAVATVVMLGGFKHLKGKL